MARTGRVVVEKVRERRWLATDALDIDPGDLLVLKSERMSPAGVETDAAGATANDRITNVQDQVADIFAGVAITGRRSTDPVDQEILVATDCIAQMDCDALGSAAEVGSQVEVNATDNGSTATADDQKVIPGSTNPIGTVARRAVTGATNMLVHFVGRYNASAPTAD